MYLHCLCLSIHVLHVLYYVMCVAAVEVCAGSLPNLFHGIQGQLCFKDQSTVVIRNFHYDSQGPGLHTCACIPVYIFMWWMVQHHNCPDSIKPSDIMGRLIATVGFKALSEVHNQFCRLVFGFCGCGAKN